LEVTISNYNIFNAKNIMFYMLLNKEKLYFR